MDVEAHRVRTGDCGVLNNLIETVKPCLKWCVESEYTEERSSYSFAEVPVDYNASQVLRLFCAWSNRSRMLVYLWVSWNFGARFWRNHRQSHWRRFWPKPLPIQKLWSKVFGKSFNVAHSSTMELNSGQMSKKILTGSLFRCRDVVQHFFVGIIRHIHHTLHRWCHRICLSAEALFDAMVFCGYRRYRTSVLIDYWSYYKWVTQLSFPGFGAVTVEVSTNGFGIMSVKH